MVEKIISLQNPRIKNIARLTKSSERRDQNLMVIEGFREITMAITSGFEIRELYFSRDSHLHLGVDGLLQQLPNSCKIFEISKAAFEKIAYRENSDGIIGLAIPIYLTPEDLKLSSNPLILVLESVEKPGNLGAILRTADAAAIDAIIVCDPQTDIYNPNVIRSSLGCIFNKQVATCTTDDAINFLKKNRIKSYAAALTGSQFYQDTDFKGPCAIVMGTEAEGLTGKWLHGCDRQIKIPMNGKVDSLNVSTSAAIIVFEAKRQRGFNDN